MKNLNKAQKRFATLFLLVLVFSIAAIAVFSVQAGGQSIAKSAPLDHIVYPPAELIQNTPALTSLAAMYAPMDTQEHWIGSVCAGMTEGGCDYFKANQATAVWDRHLGNIGSSAGYISNTAVIDENHEVWTAATSIFTQGPNDKHSTENSFDVHILVERGADQKWYLDRVLTGPGIAVEITDRAGNGLRAEK